MRMWRFALAASTAFAAVWWLHAFVDYANPKFDGPIDTAMWVVASILKLLTILCIPYALGAAFMRLCRRKRDAMKAASIWLIAGLILLSGLSFAREPLSKILNNEGVRYYPASLTSQQIKVHRWDGNEASEIVRWQSGKIVAQEVIVFVICAGCLGLIGYFSDRFRINAGITASVFLLIIIWTFGTALHLYTWDYDVFFSATLFGPLPFDLVTPFVAYSLISEIGSLAYFTLILSSYLIYTCIRGKVPSSSNAYTVASR